MIKFIRRRHAGLAIASLALWTTLGFAQSDSMSIRPLRTAPTEKFTVNAGVRDWGPATITGQTILAGGPSGRAGLFAVDMQSGKLKWTFRPANINGSVSTPPAVVDPKADDARGTLHALDLDTQKILWSYTRKTAEPNWSFGYVTPVDGGLWVDSYQALVKLQQ